MISVYQLKSRFQVVLRPLAAALATAGVTANQVTVTAAAGSLAIGVVVGANNTSRAIFLLIAVWLLLRMALNAIDGMLAREFRQKTPLGAYLNEIGDVVSDVALYAPFALVPPFDAFGVASVIVLAVISEFAGVLGPMIGATRHYEGPMGKSDRAVVFGLLALWIGLGGTLPDWIGLMMPALAALLVLTTLNRVRGGLAELSQAAAPNAPAPAIVLPKRPAAANAFRTPHGVELSYRFWPLYWVGMRANLQLGGMLSKGIALGHHTGFAARRSIACTATSRKGPDREMITRLLGGTVSGVARTLTGVRGNWQGCLPELRPRIYFANHRSHGDFVLIWTVLPPALRRQTRPVAAVDYWGRGRVRRFIGERVFDAVFVAREAAGRGNDPVARFAEALDAGTSLILFPEGTRNTSSAPLLPFKSGLYHLARARPEVELVPVWIDNMNRVLPKGEIVPVPLLCTVTFGAPLALQPGEGSVPFRERSRAALLALAPTEREAV